MVADRSLEFQAGAKVRRAHAGTHPREMWSRFGEWQEEGRSVIGRLWLWDDAADLQAACFCPTA